MKTNRFFTKLLAVMMTLALCSGMVLPALAATIEAQNICGKEEHTHTEECYNGETVEEKVLVCGKTEETVESGHAHTDACFTTTTEPNCGESNESAEPHTDACYKSYEILTCELEVHTHSDACQRSCDLEEHSHSGDCQRSCDLEEGHTHDENCLEDCTEVGHIHTDACQGSCGLPEHSHSSDCQRSCDLSEHTHDGGCSRKEVEGGKLECSEPSHNSLPEHKHTAGCYQEQTCTLDESDVVYHVHTDACYEIQDVQAPTCGKEEHKHDKTCFSGRDKETGKTLEEALADALLAAGEDGAEDTEVTLILNGQTLNYNKDGNSIQVNNGQTLNIEDAIGGGGIHGDSTSVRLIIVKNGTVNLKGGTISGGTGTGGGAIYISGEGSQLNMSGGSISGNNAIKGGNGGAVFVEGNAEFNMSGGTIENNTVIDGGNGGGVYVGKDGTFNMTGGTISNNTTDTTRYDDKNAPMGQGGGVAVGAGGKFNMSGGTIDHNTAGEGGGVFVDQDIHKNSGSFTMNGGTIDSNTAKLGEGGGVYIKGEGEITKG
ncbi:MAG: hypothetical protein HFF30_09505, partial [Flavonifractor sp.]|nr:hypothetical protein [Flavonifractor sp.]